MILDWKPFRMEGARLSTTFFVAALGDPINGDGVTFTLDHRPTCYRRGPWTLLIEVANGPGHYLWGCFDDADQPERYYHLEDSARAEAQAIADVLWNDRRARDKK